MGVQYNFYHFGYQSHTNEEKNFLISFIIKK